MSTKEINTTMNEISNHVILAVLWLMFFIVHSLFASPTVKDKLTNMMTKTKISYRLIYNLAALLLVGAIMTYQAGISSPLILDPSRWTGYIALLLFAGAVFIGFLSLPSDSIRDFIGINKSSTQRTMSSLKKKGTYSIVRHPLFIAGILFFWSLVLSEPRLKQLLTACLTTGYFIIGAFLEERKLVVLYGAEYQQYRRAVPMFIPGFRRIEN